MTTTVELPATPPGSVLVRVPATVPSWVRALPPVPGGSTVTVTISHERLRGVPADDLVSHGYRIVGVHGARSGGAPAVVDVFVPRELQRAHPAWFRSLLGRASRAFDCELGPVRRLLGPELALHLDAVPDHPDGTVA